MKKAPQANFPEFEQTILSKWNDEQTFIASLRNREGAKRYSFYDGPPFANGQPHFGHSLVTSIKDSLGRYKTMQGFYVERRNGWDTHGLPVEFAIEKELGVSGKKQILEMGLQKFNDACRASVFTYKSEWEGFFTRIGRWTDTEHAYVTMERDYTESVWWMLGQVNAKDLLYRGYKSMPYCPRCETPLSNFEVNEGYRDDVPDPSLYVKFKIVDEDASLLGWTTTPWSLPGNAAVAVNPEAIYVYVQVVADDGSTEVLILAKKRLEVLNQEYRVLKEVKAIELTGKKYEPLFDQPSHGLDTSNLFKVWASSIVSIEDGSGVLHVAPAFGEDDLNLAQEQSIPVLTTVKPNGHLTDNIELESVRDKFFKGADKLIVEYLTRKGSIYAAETFTHTYPFCYRCDSPLLYYAITTWFVRVSSIRDQLQKTAEEIKWQPTHIKTGRFGKWLEGARDWAISRNRYWGAPLPIWVNEKDSDDYIVISSLEELVELAGLSSKPDDLHRPGIDNIIIEREGKTYKRVEEVFDCWFESGSMPVAQQHYPFENSKLFETSYPADYIGEGLDQTRLWFYVLHVLSTIAFDRPAYKNVLVNGMVMAADGQKLSKRLKNYPPVDDVFAVEGADTLRFYLLGNDQAVSADYMRFSRDAMRDIQRNVFGTLWNTYSFLALYSEIIDWKPRNKLVQPQSVNILDTWLLSRLAETITEMTKQADAYQLARTLRPLRELIDDLSNWYVRRSRRRFNRNDDEVDMASAYETLHFVLVTISQLLAPWSPFLADTLWRGLTEGMNEVVSVHLSDWPQAGTVDAQLIREMAVAREAISFGLAQRSEHKIKVRQPLTSLVIRGGLTQDSPNFSQLSGLIADEVNVKSVIVQPSNDGIEKRLLQEDVILDCRLTPELRREGLVRDLIRQIQETRKQAGLDPGDKIQLILAPLDLNGELMATIEYFKDMIESETLATVIAHTGESVASPIQIGGEKIVITVIKQSNLA
jgi:isoleucyl-tRNA synthetase